MIYSLKGKLIYNDSNFLVIECGGVGFKCYTSLVSAKKVGQTGSEVSVFTYLSVREDALDLFAFASVDELEFFKLLINVSGVGPKAAVAVLSLLEPQQLVLAIAAGDVKAITRANGIGKKTAERIVLELKDKVASLAAGEEIGTVMEVAAAGDSSAAGEAVEALTSLGFTQSDSAKAVAALDKSLSSDELIRLALRSLSKNL
ncbi:MAG: Holliday junction branch migration protein RuvA [Clostridiales bacterium]|nr:Holliday junction branch migration protein RuvA [Clostridiales bacterium]